MAMSASAYRAQLQSLLPPGAAWPRRQDARLTRLLAAWAAEFARVDARTDDLLRESMALSTLEMLADWERVAGLPDDCGAALSTSDAERRADLAAKLTLPRGTTVAWFIDQASIMGYAIEIDEFRPFICGLSRCGDRLNGNAAVRYVWRVRVTGVRITYFRAGVSQCGDLLGKITFAEDLECRFRQQAPAHTRLIFDYSEVTP